MKTHFKSLALAGALALGGTAGASAATLDFTDFSSYTFSSTEASGTFMGVEWTMTSTGGVLTRNPGYDGDACTGCLSKSEMQALTGLALDGDGIGVGNDDEVSLREMVTITFERSVKLVGVYLLDLFADEEADVWVNGVFESGIASTAIASTTGGFVGVGPDEPIWLTSISFTPWVFSKKSNPDFAVAGLEIAAVPLPAGGVLLLTALGGLGLAARRRKA